MQNFSKLGLDKSLRSLTALSNRGQLAVLGVDFDTQYETQGKNVKASFLSVPNLIQFPNVATAQGSVLAGTATTVTFTLTPDTNVLGTAYSNFADPYIAIYEGTAAVAGNQIFPHVGVNIATGKFPCISGNDYRTYTKRDSVFKVNVENTSGTTAQIYVEGDWKILAYSAVEQS